VTLYIDSSALLKRYLKETETEVAERHLLSDPKLATARHTSVEIRRAIFRTLDGAERGAAKAAFGRDWGLIEVIELDETVCEKAVEIAESTRVRTLDALHLGAAFAAGSGKLPFLTFDVRQARAARSLGWTVLGV
jgi:uncharacterized protein